MRRIRKYPRTPHVLDSALQPGDEDLERAAFGDLAGRHLVVEEKLDGANAALSFSDDGQLLLQSRGHYLTGGPRERHFARLKSFAYGLRDALWARLGPRYVIYGEWLYAKHTVFYDRLPHHFLEFDVLDIERDVFLATPERRALLAGLPIHAVPVLHEGPIAGATELKALVGRSRFKSPDWRGVLAAAAQLPPMDPVRVLQQTDPSDLMEGLYIKVEAAGVVIARYKYVRADFLQTVLAAESHWLTRPILGNVLATEAQGDGHARNPD